MSSFAVLEATQLSTLGTSQTASEPQIETLQH